MAHIKSFFDNKYIGAWSLKGRDVTVQIRKVDRVTLRNRQGTDIKPVIFFEGSQLGFTCNKTNAEAIANMYGNETDEWIGKRITLYPTQTQVGSKMVDCVRVRPQKPKAKAEKLQDVPVDEAMRADQESALVAVGLKTDMTNDEPIQGPNGAVLVGDK